MGTEHMKQENSINPTIEALFKIQTIPEANTSLLRGSKLSEEGALQLFLYASSSDWQYHASRDHDTGNRKIDDILNFVYLYFTNPAYTPDTDDLSAPSLELYQYIRSRILASTGTAEQLNDSNGKANDIL